MIDHWTTHPDTQSLPAPRRIAFISDLHLFSSRCVVEEHRGAIDGAVEWADTCIWGGDLFDFRWSRLESPQRSIDESTRWLGSWCTRFPDKSFVFLRGNHDAHPPFVQRLNEWSAEQPNFVVDADAMRIGDTLFVHGDVIEKQGSVESFRRYRNTWSRKRPAGHLQNRAYDAAISFRLHWAAAKIVHPVDRTCRRLLRWMRRQNEQDTRGIRRIVFGHTHQRIDGRSLDGIRFYNGGAAIRHVPFEPIRLTVEPSDSP